MELEGGGVSLVGIVLAFPGRLLVSTQVSSMAGIHIYLTKIYSRKTYSPPMIILYSVTLVKHRPPAQKGFSVCLHRITGVPKIILLPFPAQSIQLFFLLHGVMQRQAFEKTLTVL